jgi:PAS domain S-box-containing protein
MTASDFQTFETVGALVVVFGDESRIVHWNDACSKLSGYSLDEVRGHKEQDFLLAPGELPSVEASFERAATAGRTDRHAHSWVTKGGERRWIEWSQTVSTETEGHAHSLIMVGIDRTEGKQEQDVLAEALARGEALAVERSRLSEGERHAADDLREAVQQMVKVTIRAHELNDEAEEASARSVERENELHTMADFRERFIAILGHDLRTPLAAICLNADSLQEHGHLDERDQKKVARIRRSGQRMTRMISELLDFTRARLGGGLSVEPRPADLREICRAVVREFEVPIELEITGDVTGVWDPDRLGEALSNILANAIDHARPGTVAIVRVRADADEAVVEVVNQGDPIPPDVLPYLFEPFRRVPTYEKSPTRHLGLGLYIANQIVRSGGGTIEVQSSDGTTRFLLHLPRSTTTAVPFGGRAGIGDRRVRLDDRRAGRPDRRQGDRRRPG